MVCSDVEVEPVLQDITKEQLNGGINGAQDARLDIWEHGFYDPHSSAVFDVRVCHPNAESSKSHSGSNASMKMTRSGCTRGECWMLSMGRSRRLYLQLLEGWGRNT